MTFLLKYFHIAVIFSLFSSVTLASQSNSFSQLNQLDAAEKLRQQQQQKAEQKHLQHQFDARLDTSNHQSLKLPSNESPCYPITHIILTDYAANSSKSRFQWALDNAIKHLDLTLPHCFGGDGIGILMKQIQNEIIAQGYVTTRIVTEEQDLRSGKLTLTAILGKIRNTIVMDSGEIRHFTKLNALTGFTFSKGDILNVRDIEQSLENLKHVPTVDANIEIMPSEGNDASVGESDLKISYAQAFPLRFNLGLDDSGSKSTGRLQASGTLSIDNIFTANDLFYTSFTRSIKEKGDEKGKRASQSLSFYYSIPFGYWSLSFYHNQSRYNQEVFGAFENNYMYSGRSESDKLTLSYLLYRDNVRKTILSGSIWSRKSKNYIDDAEIDVQKRRMAGWEVNLFHKEYLGNSTLEISANYKRGTGARGQLQAPEELWGEGTSRPQIITASISYLKPFTLWEQPWQFNTSWSSQWNKTPLIMQDRFSLGGRYTVRGFDGELTLTGERGWLWRNELAWDVKSSGQQIYFGVDVGRVMGWSIENQLGHYLVGTALGIRGNLGRFSYDVFVGKPIRKPEGFKTSNTVAGFNLNYAF